VSAFVVLFVVVVSNISQALSMKSLFIILGSVKHISHRGGVKRIAGLIYEVSAFVVMFVVVVPNVSQA
jgi:hypothetical protein